VPTAICGVATASGTAFVVVAAGAVIVFCTAGKAGGAGGVMTTGGFFLKKLNIWRLLRITPFYETRHAI
jgi:hypothetical protein